MFVARMIMIVAFSVTGVSILTFQGIEIAHVLADFFHKKG